MSDRTKTPSDPKSVEPCRSIGKRTPLAFSPSDNGAIGQGAISSKVNSVIKTEKERGKNNKKSSERKIVKEI